MLHRNRITIVALTLMLVHVDPTIVQLVVMSLVLLLGP